MIIHILYRSYMIKSHQFFILTNYIPIILI